MTAQTDNGSAHDHSASGLRPEEPVGKSKDYADRMICYANVSGMSKYWARVIETKGFRQLFESLVDVEEKKL